MLQTNYKDDWLERAFRLAFFLHGERETAKRIAASAMNKLETASNAQFKRHYYTPQGRADSARGARSRVSLDDLRLLQRLVFVESEIYERQKETRAGAANLLKFFIKHLVRISLKRNSFYVTLGVARILHNYATSDVMEIYNLVVQDPERVHDDYYYRSRKGVLMKELKQRFGELVQIVKVGRGEERFSRAAKSENFAEIARAALASFTPWNSKCAIPDEFNPFDDVIKPFHFAEDDPDEEHATEIRRIHAAIHPNCFERLTSALKLPAPEEKMEIPKFMTNTDESDDDRFRDWRNPPSLGADELREIKEILRAHAESRNAMSAGFLRVLTDGRESAWIDLAETDRVAFAADDAAELIEIYAHDGEAETLLAARLVSHAELRGGRQAETIRLEGGQEIAFELAPVLDEFGEIAEINFVVRYRETAWSKRFALALRRARFRAALMFKKPILKPATAFGLILLALVTGWLILRKPGDVNNQFANTNSTPENRNAAVNQMQPAPPAPPEQIMANKPTPENLPPNKRFEPQKNEERRMAKNPPKRENQKPEIAPRKDALLKEQQSDVAIRNNPDRRDETDANGVLRLPIRENNQRRRDFDREERKSRGNSKKFKGKSLKDIKLVYLEISGDRILGKEIADRIADELGAAGVFLITADREPADAALKIYVRHESDGETRAEASAAAIVRLVNAEGFVVYPHKKGISGWKYVGTMAKLPSCIAADLLKAKR